MQKYSFLFKSQQPPLKNLTFVHFLTFLFILLLTRSAMGAPLFWHFVAFDAGNALLFSGVCKIRYRREPPTVPNMRAVLKKASYGTRRIFKGTRCKKQASGVRKEYSVPETPSYGTRRVSKGAKQPTPRTVDRLLLHRTHPQRRETAASADCEQPPPVRAPTHKQLDHTPDATASEIWSKLLKIFVIERVCHTHQQTQSNNCH